MSQAPASGPRVAVIGAGWAGLAAAVQLVQGGARVSVFEMARRPGGRARQADGAGQGFDNGQHILIGAYSATLGLMRTVGADPAHLLLRQPLALVDPAGRGLRLPPGPPLPAFARAVLGARHWALADRLALITAAGGWLARRFRCPPGWTVQQLCSRLPPTVQAELIDPLCVAALNTPMSQASAAVFLRVLHDALFSGRGSADLLLPRAPLSALLPDPAWRWLAARGAALHTGHRVGMLQATGQRWLLDGDAFDMVVLACSATEAARLAATAAPAWSAVAAALRYEPIVTAWLRDDRLQHPQAMVALPPGLQAPAQFAFNLGQLHHDPALHGVWAFVASSAAPWLANGLAACGQAMLAQARQSFAGAFGGPDAQVLLHTAAERRATFACTPALARPAMRVAPGLLAAGDHVQGPYPATLEGAVRSGQAAAHASLTSPDTRG
ncbi:MAG: hydroxysqualene dehydroxylase HpnE [Aquabacterium sp.]|nr:hydroxysqualene dehydroxylase HpnE [Aquabacterium sp.]